MPNQYTINPQRLTLALATILSGLSAGFFYTYSASVTRGLALVTDEIYVESFQAINSTVQNVAFAVIFFGSIPAIVVALAASWRGAGTLVRSALALALGLYLIGVLITVTGNVPLNTELAEATPLTADLASTARAGYEDGWNRLNLYRTVFFVASFASVALTAILAGESTRRSGVGNSPAHTG